MLMSTQIPLPKTVFCHGFVTGSDGKKMSKSLKNVVNPDDVLKKYDADTVRYFICCQTHYGKRVFLFFYISNLKCDKQRQKLNQQNAWESCKKKTHTHASRETSDKQNRESFFSVLCLGAVSTSNSNTNVNKKKSKLFCE